MSSFVLSEYKAFVSFLCALGPTTELESFHNHILTYASKRFYFSPPACGARARLAGLDYNHHVDRPTYVELYAEKKYINFKVMYQKAYNLFFYSRYGKVCHKKSRKWSLYTIKEEKDYNSTVALQSAIL